MFLRTGPFCLALMLAAGTARADTSATLATAINLPKGPASIEGFGQGYDLSPASGLPSLSYPIDVPPGRAGLQPQLALHYSAGEGAGALGLGWSLGLPTIERSLRTGIPHYDTADAWTLRGLGGGEELTEVAPGVYREHIEQGAPVVVRALPGGAMSAVTTDGTGYLFGLTDDARLSGDAGDFRLELSAITDVHGNRVDCHYTREPSSTAPLLSAITYNDGRAVVRLDYEERPDVVRARASGFAVELHHRLHTITTEVDGALVRTTTLTYARSVMSPASMLAQIDTIASDGAAMPSWYLDYTGAFDKPRITTIEHAPALDPTADGRAWVDIDGDALPDLLDATLDIWRYRQGRGTALAATWTEFPAPAVTLTKFARFADLTGDGIEDLLAQPGEGELWAYTGGDTPFGTAAPINLDLSFDLTATNVALVDLNLDGRVDVLRHDDADGWIWLRHHDAPGYLPAEPAPPPPPGMRLGDPGVQLADLDGDRLPDLVRVMPSDSRILIAAGEGFGLFADPIDLTGVPAMIENERWELADLSGDGAADLVRIGGASLDLYTYQHDGSLAAAASVAWPELEADEVVILSDIDASGTIDVLRVDTDGSQPWRAWSFAERPGLLASLRTGLGYRQKFTYTPAAVLAITDADAGTPWASTPPTAMPVLTLSEETDAHTPWKSTTSHHARDGWYDPARGEFRGFAELRDSSPGDAFSESATTTTRYDLGQLDEARKLQLITSETASPRGVLVREEHTLEVDTPTPGVQAVRRVATDTYHLEAGPESAAARVRTEWDYDSWANVLEERALGRVDLKTGADMPGDERITTYQYAEPTADGPRDRIAEQFVADADGTQTTAIRTYYDGPPEQGAPLGQLDARGIVARVETWLDGDTWVPTLRQLVDARGNVTQIRDAEGGTLQRHYDDTGLFPVEERLLLAGADDLVTTATWDARTGNPLAVTAPNSATTRAEYDGLGRLVAEIEPGDTPDLPTTRYRYHLDGTAARPSILTELRRLSGEPEVDITATHLDGLGRTVLDVTQDDTGTAAILHSARRYSERGEVAELIAGQPIPAAALLPGAIIKIADAWPRGVTHHDALGRLVWTRDADGYETAVAHTPLALERRDHEDLHPAPPYTGTPERTEHDGLGRILAITNHLDGRSITHHYEHDAADRLTAHLDPAGHRTAYTYDGAGRLTNINSPDAGHTRQHFDATGRLTERIDATGARITWSFDQLGRLTRERAFDSTNTQVSDIRRFYDHGGPFTRGQFVAAEDAAGRVDFTHDARGRITLQTRRFDTARGPVTLSTAHVYDAQDRPLRDIYPDGTILDHAYTARGLEAPGEFAEADYDALARWLRLSLAPGIELTRDLDHTGRVQHQRVAQKSTHLLDLAHRYDIAGQLVETRDNLAAENVSLSQTYVYDDLRRLAASTAQGKTSRWRYSDDGNLLEQAGRALTYDSARPHAATRLDAQHLTYDPAGQLAEIAGEGALTPGTWQFDPHGRVQSFIDDDSRRVEHVYSYSGERAIRREYDAHGDLAHETLYFTKNAEVRDGQLVRWIFFAGERIAESTVPMPRRGFAELPAEVVAAVHPSRGPPLPLDIMELVALALLIVLALISRRLGRHARPLRWAPATALVLAGVTALSCRHHDTARPLVPDAHTRYHVADRLGSAALVLDHRGRPLARDATEPYGAARLTWRSGQAVSGPTYRFTGKEDDPLSGAVAIGARHYLPELGRWASPDPLYLLTDPDAALSDPRQANPYSYVGGNPVTFTDPTGRKGVAHGSERRPGVLDSYPDSPNAGFDTRTAAVENDRAIAEQRAAELKVAALTVMDSALTALDWAMTASDIADTVTMTTGAFGAGIKVTKMGGKAAVRQSKQHIRRALTKAIKGATDTAKRVASAVKPSRAGPKAGKAGGPGAGARFSEKTRDEAERQAKGRCVFCGTETKRPAGPNQRQTDHAIPRSRGGNSGIDNAQNTCRNCNLSKGAKTTQEFLTK